MQRLRRAAKARGVSVAAVIRDAVDHVVRDDVEARAELQRRAFSVTGRWRSGHADTAERHDEVLAEPDW